MMKLLKAQICLFAEIQISSDIVASLNKIKMKNTKTSNLNQGGKKREGFRVMVKQRHNHRLQADQSKGHYGLLSKSTQINWKHKDGAGNYSEIKNYVKNRMRTQGGNKSAMSRLSSAEKTVERDEKSASNSKAITKQNRVGDPKVEESLSASRYKLDKSGEHSTRRQIESGSKGEEIPMLEVLEKKIQELLDKRLSVCVQFKKDRDAALELELDSMVIALKGMKKEDPEAIEAEILYLDRKIKLFQRLMAQNMTQSQIMKRYFLAKVSSRPQHRRYHTEVYATAQMLSTRRFCETPLRESVVNSSMTKQVYKAPAATAYNIFRYSNKFFNADRHKQPLPRSSYNREYLVNPQTRDKTIVPVDNIFMGKTTSAKFLSSSYQADFRPKQTDRINIKELDACRNKIKSLAVEYGRKDRNSLSPNSYSMFLEKQLGEERTRVLLERPTFSYKKLLLSESRRQYRKNEKVGISSEIKHENLQTLKYRYLKKFNI